MARDISLEARIIVCFLTSHIVAWESWLLRAWSLLVEVVYLVSLARSCVYSIRTLQVPIPRAEQTISFVLQLVLADDLRDPVFLPSLVGH